jgi:hypothetical protein
MSFQMQKKAAPGAVEGDVEAENAGIFALLCP